jgi:hypothetical protein
VKVQELQGGVAVGPVTQLPAGSIAQASSAGVLVKHSSVAEAETYMSWRSGYIPLCDTELAAAVAEFNRYNQKQTGKRVELYCYIQLPTFRTPAGTRVRYQSDETSRAK